MGYVIAEAQGRQCSVVESVTCHSSGAFPRGGNCPVFGPLHRDVADDKQRGARVFLSCLTSFGGEDDLGFESYLHFLVKLESLISVDPPGLTASARLEARPT